jgi:hypothetical protein
MASKGYPMRDLLLQCAGVAGIAVSLIHGVLGETKVFAKATIQPESLRTLIRLVWQAGTVAWIGGAVLLIAAPSLGSESARHWIVITVIAIYAFAAAANAWWSRGRGVGWKALTAVVAVPVAAYQRTPSVPGAAWWWQQWGWRGASLSILERYPCNTRRDYVCRLSQLRPGKLRRTHDL